MVWISYNQIAIMIELLDSVLCDGILDETAENLLPSCAKTRLELEMKGSI